METQKGFNPRDSAVSTRSNFEEEPDFSLSTDLFFKVILVGDSGVGKTTLLKWLVNNKFEENHNITIGVEFSSYLVQIDTETIIKLQIWDTAGQESFRSIVRFFYRNSAGVFLVYNICNQASFEQLDGWVDEARKLVEDDTIFVLIRNHSDKDQKREVQYSDAERFMHEKGINFFLEISELSGLNVEIAFREAAKLIYLKYLRSLTKRKLKGGMARKSLNIYDLRAQRATISKKALQQKKTKRAIVHVKNAFFIVLIQNIKYATLLEFYLFCTN